MKIIYFDKNFLEFIFVDPNAVWLENILHPNLFKTSQCHTIMGKNLLTSNFSYNSLSYDLIFFKLKG